MGYGLIRLFFTVTTVISSLFNGVPTLAVWQIIENKLGFTEKEMEKEWTGSKEILNRKQKDDKTKIE